MVVEVWILTDDLVLADGDSGDGNSVLGLEDVKSSGERGIEEDGASGGIPQVDTTLRVADLAGSIGGVPVKRVLALPHRFKSQ